MKKHHLENYSKNEKALAKLTTQQQQLIAAKNAVFGIGAERGIQGIEYILKYIIKIMNFL